jgi:hypothetical protein
MPCGDGSPAVATKRRVPTAGAGDIGDARVMATFVDGLAVSEEPELDAWRVLPVAVARHGHMTMPNRMRMSVSAARRRVDDAPAPTEVIRGAERRPSQ